MRIQCNLTVHRIKQEVFSSKTWSSCCINYASYFWKHLKAFVESLMPSEKTQENIQFRENDQIWVLAFHQLFLFILVAGRAVMPRNGSCYLYEFHRRISHHLKTYGPNIWHTPEIFFYMSLSRQKEGLAEDRSRDEKTQLIVGCIGSAADIIEFVSETVGDVPDQLCNGNLLQNFT